MDTFKLLVKAVQWSVLSSIDKVKTFTFAGKINGHSVRYAVEIPLPTTYEGWAEWIGESGVQILLLKQVRTLIRNRIASLDPADSSEKKADQILDAKWELDWFPVHYNDRKPSTAGKATQKAIEAAEAKQEEIFTTLLAKYSAEEVIAMSKEERLEAFQKSTD